MQLGRNLHSALKQLRYSNRPRRLWVDAVCINQDDIDERNVQVMRMGATYSLATRVVIWLGSEAEDSTHTLSTIADFGEQVEFTVEGFLADAPGASEPMWWNPSQQCHTTPELGHLLTALLARPWFSRVWVIQEALLGSRQTIIQCGDAFIPWPPFRKAVLVMSQKEELPQELRNLTDTYRGNLLPRSHWSLFRLLLWT
ncbi:heterokaryon incompatibility protein-domain-containing protein [Lasiosphaeria miniovina]|uniref:Heterokaryon incompatibility protein-domain-containing protein n=1 Tax=Lasiosphaeria miniovina TaxID=1954250 RepID=A0AA40B4G7_9PEZI|nr:heterokaryon incompatibility protein-domain-containing protein [Lasiosphaeria miniovina]KAK0727322.1 heterokaryon incompatibility protein-domain-containing protein [Lasiosphaeria miniovina]